MESRLISIDEANRMLPLLRHIVRDIVKNWELIIYKRTELECLEKGLDSVGPKLSPEARETVVNLAEQAGFTAWHAGPLQNSAAAEALTSLLIFMNKRYKSDHTGLRITGISKD